MKDMIEKFQELKIVPVVVLERVEDALPLADALIAGGLPVAEVTFRTDAAEEAIRTIAANRPDMLVGAGTVINVDQCKKALAAGAKFIVTPGFSDEVTAYCVENNVPIFPGICTPSELMKVVNAGLPVAKFFPAEAFGGLKTIKALAGPFPKMKFMPTGGVSEANVMDYLNDSHIVAAGGSWMVKGDLIKAGKFDEIEAMTKSAVALVNA